MAQSNRRSAISSRKVEVQMQQQFATTQRRAAMRLNPLALVIAFGVAGVVEVILFGVVMGAMWGMMGGGGMHGSAGGAAYGGGWMMGGAGYGGGSMMGGGIGFVVYALFWGLFAGAIAGAVSAWVYNNVIARNER